MTYTKKTYVEFTESMVEKAAFELEIPISANERAYVCQLAKLRMAWYRADRDEKDCCQDEYFGFRDASRILLGETCYNMLMDVFHFVWENRENAEVWA